MSPGLKRAENMYNMRPLKHIAYVWQNGKKQKNKTTTRSSFKKKNKIPKPLFGIHQFALIGVSDSKSQRG